MFIDWTNCNKSLPNPKAVKSPAKVNPSFPKAVIYFPISFISTPPEDKSLPPINRLITAIIMHKPNVQNPHKELFDLIDCFNKGLLINMAIFPPLKIMNQNKFLNHI